MRLGWKALIPVTLVWLAGRGLHGRISTSVRGRGIRDARHTQFHQDLPALGAAAGHVGDRSKALFQRKVTRQLPGGEDAAERRASAACMRCAAIRTARSAASPASSARRCARRSPSRSNRTWRRRHAPHHALRHRPVQVHLLRLLRGGLPGRCHRRDPHPRIPHGESRREHHEQGQAARRSASATKP